VAVSHLDLELTVDFETHRLEGRATLSLVRGPEGADADRLHLDTRDLTIEAVRRLAADGTEDDAPFTLGDEVPFLGRELEVEITPATTAVAVDYSTSPDAGALGWLEGEQTVSGEPFLFSQSQAVLARTWVPLQDTPAVRMTYDATLRVPPGLLALMSAENPTETSPDGIYHFHMPQPIPSYLMAVAVGDLAFAPLGERSGVYAEPPVLERAAWELADLPRMIEAAEALYGPYRWGRYDVLILPPSFPFGGMENPRLTFATPTILAGDRSLVALVAHELAHSWSGNLVTNATWDDFWLNEGFTTYFELRIMEALEGRDYADMLAALGRQNLEARLAELGPDSPDTRLHLDLAGRDPDEGMTDIAYDKGSAFLQLLEETVGRERFDAFLRGWFDRHAFESEDTAAFVAELQAKLLSPEQMEQLKVREWVYGPGLPANAPEIEPEAFEAVDAQLAAFAAGTPAAELATEGWNTHQWLHFLRGLPSPLAAERMADLDAAFRLTDSGNSEILAAWLELAVASGYHPADAALEEFLIHVGRRKFLEPLYRALAATPEGLERAREIYRRARPGYHPLSRGAVEEILAEAESAPPKG
jgi:aminopeptidase N